MNIPYTYYLRFWFRNSLFALVICYIIILLVPPLFILFPFSGLWGFLVYQFFIYRYFFDKRRGDFEYTYREELIEAPVRKAIKITYGYLSYFRYKLDKLNQINNFSIDILQKLINESSMSENDNLLCFLFIKLSDAYFKDDNHSKARYCLEKVLEKKPNDFVANFKLAIAMERCGDGNSAIRHYRSSLSDHLVKSSQLKDFIKSQIARVQNSGPKKSPPLPGVRYLTW